MLNQEEMYSEEEYKEEQYRRKLVLIEYLNRKDIKISLSDIEHSGSWHIGEFTVGKRIYTVDEIAYVRYGDDWYKYHEYCDIGKYRVSMCYYICGLSQKNRTLHIGCEQVFT